MRHVDWLHALVWSVEAEMQALAQQSVAVVGSTLKTDVAKAVAKEQEEHAIWHAISRLIQKSFRVHDGNVL